MIEDEKLQLNCAVTGTNLIKKCALLRDEFSIVGDVRGKGLMLGIELVEDKVNNIMPLIKDQSNSTELENCVVTRLSKERYF